MHSNEPKYTQRDIILIPFPYSDLTGSKLRPALIISNEKINHSEDRICCLITSNSPQDGISINSYEQGSLPFKSWIKPRCIFTIHEKIIKKKLCKVTASIFDKTIQRLNEMIQKEKP